MMDELLHKWNARYRELSGQPVAPCQVLADYSGLLPLSGSALDLACGRGGNAMLLAQHGLDTCAWDLSDIAIDELKKRAHAAALSIDCRVTDVSSHPPAVASFDVIVVSYFLERGLAGSLQQALRPGGLLYYQTFSGEQHNGRGPNNPHYRLKSNELLTLFSQLKLIYYDESGQNFDGECLYIGQKT